MTAKHQLARDRLAKILDQRDHRLLACQAAMGFWDRVAADARIGPDFRALARGHGTGLRELAGRV